MREEEREKKREEKRVKQRPVKRTMCRHWLDEVDDDDDISLEYLTRENDIPILSMTKGLLMF